MPIIKGKFKSVSRNRNLIGKERGTDSAKIISGSVGNSSLPAGVENQTLRYNASNEIEANSRLTNDGDMIGIDISDVLSVARALNIILPSDTSYNIQYGVYVQVLGQDQIGFYAIGGGVGGSKSAFYAKNIGTALNFSGITSSFISGYSNTGDYFRVSKSGQIRSSYYNGDNHNNIVATTNGTFEKELKNIGYTLSDTTNNTVNPIVPADLTIKMYGDNLYKVMVNLTFEATDVDRLITDGIELYLNYGLATIIQPIIPILFSPKYSITDAVYIIGTHKYYDIGLNPIQFKYPTSLTGSPKDWRFSISFEFLLETDGDLEFSIAFKKIDPSTPGDLTILRGSHIECELKNED